MVQSDTIWNDFKLQRRFWKGLQNMLSENTSNDCNFIDIFENNVSIKACIQTRFETAEEVLITMSLKHAFGHYLKPF